MNQLRTSIVLLATIVLAAPRAGAVVVEKVDGSRVVGYLERADDREVVVRRIVDEEEQLVAIPRAEVAFLLEAFDPERLAELDPSDPDAYRDYAEELSEKQNDPEAIDTARRLYHLAATLNPEGLGRGALLGLADVSDDPGERRRARAAAYLLDPRHDRAVLRDDEAPDPSRRRPGRGAKALADTLRSYRNRQFAAAQRASRQPGFEEAYRGAAGLPPFEEFMTTLGAIHECATCDEDGRVRCPTCLGKGRLSESRNRPGFKCPDCEGWGDLPCPDCGGRKADVEIPEDLLPTLLRAELAAGPPPAPSPSGREAKAGWSESLRHPPSTAPTLNLADLTEFDTTRTVYRAGEWTHPDPTATKPSPGDR